MNRCLIVFFLFSIAVIGKAIADDAVEFDIKRQSLATALLDFSYQANIQVLMPGHLAEGLIAPAIKGLLTPTQALKKLLANKGLSFTFSETNTVSIQNTPDQELSRERQRRYKLLRMEQLLVTTSSRPDSIANTAVSKSSLKGADMESRGITRAEQLQGFFPGLSVESAQLARTEFTVRAGGLSNDDLSSRSGVAVYIDDVYIPRQGAANIALYELERIELLRGPQSTLYGLNATAGALSYVTRKPSADFEARYMLDFGSDQLVNNVLTVNGAMTESLAGQVSIASFQRGAYARNTFPNQNTGNDVNDLSGRLSFKYAPRDTYDWLISLDSEQRDQDAVLYSIGPSDSFQFAEGLPVVMSNSADPRTTAVDTSGNEQLSIDGFMSRVNIYSDDYTSSYIVGWRQHGISGLYDLDQSANKLVNQGIQENSEMFSLEARIASHASKLAPSAGEMSWTAGVLVMQEQAETHKRFDAPGLSAGVNDWHQSFEEQSYSVYGQWHYSLTTKLRLLTGLRYLASFRDFDVAGFSTAAADTNPYLEENYLFTDKRDWRRLTPRLALHYQTSPETLLYSSIATGYKPGGTPTAAANLVDASSPYAHERVVSFEAGIRSNWFANRIQFNTSVYQAEFEDMQIFGIDNVGNSLIANAKEVSVNGFEMEMQARPLAALNIRLAVAYIDSEFEQFALSLNDQWVDKAGESVPRVPNLTANLSAIYLFPETAWGGWSIRADAVYSDEAVDLNGDLAWLDYSTNNLWLDLHTHNGLWELSLWVRNLRDQEYFRATSPGVSASTLGFARELESPRTVGVSVKHYW